MENKSNINPENMHNPAPEVPPVASGAPSDATPTSQNPLNVEIDNPAKNGMPNFKMNFDFDREYEDAEAPEEEEPPIRRGREKRTGCAGGAMFLIVIVCISLLLASVLWLGVSDVLGFGSGEETVVVTIPRDATIDDIATELRQAGLIKYEKLFKLYSSFSDSFEQIAPGTYELSLNFDYRAIVYGMSTRSGSRVATTVTIPEGFSLKQMFDMLEARGVCSADELWEVATNTEFDYKFLEGLPLGDSHRLEGFLFPDTYDFWLNDSAGRVIRKMLDNFDNRFKEEWYKTAEDMGYTVREIVIIASIIEREAGAPSDRAKIASVIYNRLTSSDLKRLEIDATIFYAIAETGESFSTTLDSPYNSYRHEGLPPGAISNPGIAAIKAALAPDSTNFYYYALSKAEDRHHEFFRTYEEQRAFVNSDQYGG